MKNIYICGPTVYSKVHIGNMRPIMTFDIFNRANKHLKNEINIIHNITDIDDKIIEAAAKENISESEISEKYKNHYMQMLQEANVLKPNSMPSVVENMDKMIAFITLLIKTGNAYESNGSVYFSVETIENYGHISKRTLENAKHEKTDDKQHPADFAIWKNTNKGIQFDSPWSKGRPGWHTECAVFVNNELKGESLDIHGGGIDLLFPHHENEDAQYQAINKKGITKEWVHTGHINLDNIKMSKSIGNVWLADEFFKEYSSDVLRYIFLTSSISSPINISQELIKQVVKQIYSWKKAYIQTQLWALKESSTKGSVDMAKNIIDWNFSQAMVSLNSSMKDFRKEPNDINANELSCMLNVLGFEFTKTKLTDDELKLFVEWDEYRANNDYEKADEIRNVLVEKELI